MQKTSAKQENWKRAWVRETTLGLAVVGGGTLIAAMLVLPVGIAFDKLEKSFAKPQAAFAKHAAIHEAIRK